LVFVESIPHSDVVLHEQTTVHDLEGVDLDRCSVPLGDAVSAIAAELRLVFAESFSNIA